MTLAHLVFAGHFVMMATRRGPVRHAQPWARERERELAPEVVS
jgi:hypothetical protein